MTTEHLILAALSVSNGKDYSPVQLQKMFFLIDRNISHFIGGTHFNFEPYNYGPFDKNVYTHLEKLKQSDYVMTSIDQFSQYKTYRLTVTGQNIGVKIFDELTAVAKQYLKEVDEFVRTTPFAELINSIYTAYPEMKVNSIFTN